LFELQHYLFAITFKIAANSKSSSAFFCDTSNSCEGGHIMQLETPPGYQQQTYKPAIAIDQATKKSSLAKIPLVTTDALETLCGYARRIGYCGPEENDFALYRLKIRVEGQRYPMMMLPGLFILKDGYFSPADSFAD
jgi:hypothetical protein